MTSTLQTNVHTNMSLHIGTAIFFSLSLCMSCLCSIICSYISPFMLPWYPNGVHPFSGSKPFFHSTYSASQIIVNFMFNVQVTLITITSLRFGISRHIFLILYFYTLLYYILDTSKIKNKAWYLKPFFISTETLCSLSHSCLTISHVVLKTTHIVSGFIVRALLVC